MPENKTDDQKVQKLDELLREIKVAMLTTSDASGHLHSRPMHLQGGLEGGSLFFFTRLQTPMADEIRQDAQVNCAFADPSAIEYVSVAGRASLSQDRALMQQKWDETLKAWMPQGLDTPGIALIRVEVEEAQYWDMRRGAVLQLYSTIKAALTGEGISDAGENEKVSL